MQLLPQVSLSDASDTFWDSHFIKTIFKWSITGSHFLKNFFFTGGCPTVPVSNVSLSLSWACDPYIGEQIILNKFIVMPWWCCFGIQSHLFVGQLIYVNCYGVTSAAYVLLTTLVSKILNNYIYDGLAMFFFLLVVITVSLSMPSKLYFAHPKPAKVYCWTKGAGRSAWSRQVHKLFWPPSPLPGAPSYCQPAMVIISFYSLTRRKKK